MSLTCAVTSLSTLAVLVIQGGYENPQAFHAMGYWPVGLGESFRALFLTALLFLGPLFETLVVEGYWREWTTGEPLKEVFSDWITWRNLVAVSSFRFSLPSPGGRPPFFCLLLPTLPTY